MKEGLNRLVSLFSSFAQVEKSNAPLHKLVEQVIVLTICARSQMYYYERILFYQKFVKLIGLERLSPGVS